MKMSHTYIDAHINTIIQLLWCRAHAFLTGFKLNTDFTLQMCFYSVNTQVLLTIIKKNSLTFFVQRITFAKK